MNYEGNVVVVVYDPVVAYVMNGMRRLNQYQRFQVLI